MWRGVTFNIAHRRYEHLYITFQDEGCMNNHIQIDDTHSTVLHDRYGRPLNSLRLSVTQRCNLECFYCHREGEPVSDGEMTWREISKIADIACQLGMKKVKITGGEPLVREDLSQIVSSIAEDADEVSLTTNGVLLEEYAPKLAKAGLKRVNVSLPSPSPTHFQRVTGRDCVHRVKRGIKKASETGLHPVKINMVLLKGINIEEVQEAIDFAQQVNAILQIIEFQPILPQNYSHWKKFHYDPLPIEKRLKKESISVQENPLHHRKRYTIQRRGGSVRVEVVRPMHNSSFCQNCTRLRVTTDGKLKPCLLRNDNLVDIISPIREGSEDDHLKKVFQKAVRRREPYWKPEKEEMVKTHILEKGEVKIGRQG